MIPGTRPARRSDRAAPLPARERVAALIRLTLAIVYPRLKPCNAKEIPRQPPGVPVMPRKPALITARLTENKEMPQAAGGCGYRTANASRRQCPIRGMCGLLVRTSVDEPMSARPLKADIAQRN